MERIEFLKEPVIYFNENEFVAQISKVVSKDKLLNELSRTLNFPDYFGNNWDALFDCLRDFSWIKEKGIALVHLEIPNISADELKTYTKILDDSIQDWKEGEDHYFKVIFPQESEQFIKKIISNEYT
jgi:RNAse (barnase) inhibitor barstar